MTPSHLYVLCVVVCLLPYLSGSWIPTCLTNPYFFFCIGMPSTSKVQALDIIVANFLCHTFAESTKKTNMLYLKSFCSFCNEIGILPIPLSQVNLTRYIAHLSCRLKFSSIQNYLSIISLLHKEAGLPSPLDSHLVHSVLKGTRRVLGDANCSKLPITPKLLMGIFSTLCLKSAFDLTFWAA